ncbi:aldo/keto reductase [Gordonia sp. KTR9]|uniref:aldo/keto reductase n=1 Tax=Gordonia sp. KTR9 TaxID=337191 RepID=UPI00027DD849|nr:aldo/keto reductase [Gordonia sp. KTR9]AFR47898.1 aryl- alcohol dehydrogenase-like predicted oxidoreductase [Gordonia sp. KTR9]
MTPTPDSPAKVILGTATFGVSPLADDAPALIRGALDRGVEFFDTANSYGNQPDYDRPSVPDHTERLSSEEILGRALAGIRDRVQLASKVGEPLGRDRVNGPFVGQLTRGHIFEQVDLSLRRLRTDYLDLYYAHQPDPHTPAGETVAAFDDLVTAGKIRAWGISNFSAAETEAVVRTAVELGARPPSAHQVRYNLAERRIERTGVVAAACSTGTPLHAYAPVAGGLLAGRRALDRDYIGHRRWGGVGFSEAQRSAGRRFAGLAAEWGVHPSSLALAWLMNRPGVTGVVMGTSSMANLDHACTAGELTLSRDQLVILDSLRFGDPVN